MHAEYFMNNVKMNDYVKDSEECKPVIINALKAMYDLNMNGPSNSDFTNPLTRPRLPYAILFAIGGWSGGSPTNAIEAYDARADRWVNVTCEEESPRAYHGAAYLKGYVYIIGGFDSVDYFNSKTFLGTTVLERSLFPRALSLGNTPGSLSGEESRRTPPKSLAE